MRSAEFCAYQEGECSFSGEPILISWQWSHENHYSTRKELDDSNAITASKIAPSVNVASTITLITVTGKQEEV